MKNHKTIFLLLVLNLGAATGLFAHDTSLPPLSNYTTALDPGNKSPDQTEIAYFANRSAILLKLVCAYLSEGGTTTKQYVEKYGKMAEIYERVGLVISNKIYEKNPDFIKEQKKTFQDLYFAEMKRGRLSENTIFTKQIGLDLDLATKHYSTFKAFDKAITPK
jgi:hypothetical protein